MLCCWENIHSTNLLLMSVCCLQVSYLLGKQSYSGQTQSEVSLLLSLWSISVQLQCWLQCLSLEITGTLICNMCKLQGGFKDNAVSTANLLESSATDVNGKPYYKLSLLTRTADNTEGGRHQIIVGTVADGKLYLLKAQAGDKRWFKGTKKFVEGVANSFSVVGWITKFTRNSL